MVVYLVFLAMLVKLQVWMLSEPFVTQVITALQVLKSFNQHQLHKVEISANKVSIVLKDLALP